ncbi:MAG: sulfatase-like hydrolase/transferase [Bacilli bacterium]|nr:sulfatase-like hydrolase/transferase [Bacilli bacterium]
MKLKKWFIIFLSLLYLDLIFNLFTYDTYLRESVINIFLFDLVNSFIIFLVTNIFNKKISMIIGYIIYGFLWFWYSLFYIFYNVLDTPFSVALFRQADQTLKFGWNVVLSILQNFHIVVLFLIPLILLIIFRKKYSSLIIKKKNLIVYLILFIVSISLFITNIFVQERDNGSIYNLYFESNNVSLNIERLGVVNATYLDVYRFIFGFDEKIEEVTNIENESNDLFKYDYNVTDLKLPSGNSQINKINNYVSKDTGTLKNKYTGMFKDMNLIYIVAESFSEIAVSKELTPTLYKLVHDGFDFTNFYTSNNLSTIGGEFQALTGLYADNQILSSWRGGKAYYPYGIGTVFKNLGYKVQGYHNNSAYYQDRNVYLKNLGISNFKGCYNGLEKLINCNKWPQSDVEMINATYKDYINSDKPFMTYYMTVSGHFYYTKSANSMVAKNYKYVKDLDYSEEVKGYIATQIELDRALESLLDKLEEAGKLDNTVIVLLADHYPYNLSIKHINELSTYKRDTLIEANSNNLIIYNRKMKNVVVDKVAMSIDVLPTVLNLFGVEYDSRLIMGRDILSTTEGIAIFKNKSWVTNKGTYYASTSKFNAKEEVSDDYVDTINSIVNNRVALSRMIVDNNYYKHLMK